jgi:hypothetical protein
MCIGLHVKCPFFLPFAAESFKKNTQISNFKIIHPVGATFFHAGG